MPSESLQIAFIQYISRLFKEGDFSATYKFAFLNALADICVESGLEERLVIPVRHITEKMIELYWAQARPFSGKDKFLSQNTGIQAAMISRIIAVQDTGVSLGAFKRDKEGFNKFVTAVNSFVVTGPLWRLQILSDTPEEFLYKKYNGNQSIQLNSHIQQCFHIYYDLVISLTRDRWQQKIRSIPINYDLVGKKGDLENFLFGLQRKSLNKAREVYRDIQQGQCFYCRKSLEDEVAVDHFIPWARYPNDLGHNFVLAHTSCNSRKKDFLPSLSHFEHWKMQNIEKHGDEISERLAAYFLCDAGRSLSVVDWAYKVNAGKLWVSGGRFE